MKILHIYRQFYPSIGGVERVIELLCMHLRKKGHESDVLTLNKIFDSGNILEESENYKGIRIFRIPYYFSQRYPIAPSVLYFLKQYDIIHIHAVDFFLDFLVLTKIFHKRKLVLSTHGGYFHTKKNNLLKKIFFKIITKNSLRFIDKTIAISHNDYQLFSRVTKNLVLIENGIDFNKFGIVQKRIVNGVFIYFGRIAKNKGIYNLLRIFEELKNNYPDVHLYLIGRDENELCRYSRFIEENDLTKNVTFLGTLSDEEVNKHLAYAQYFISGSEYEGFGLTVLEAMSTGTIPIVNDIDSFKNIISHGQDGYLLNFANIHSTAQFIGTLIDQNQNYLEMQIKTKIKAKKYSFDKVVDKYLTVYESSVKKI